MSSQQLDNTCQNVLNVFKRLDPKALIFPGIGLPSQNNGVCLITHTMGDGSKMKINGLVSNSPLANNALFSFEKIGGQWLNLYEIMIPDTPNGPGQPSAAEVYATALVKNGLNSGVSHFHWWASEPYMAAIHHQNVGMDPVDFVNKTVNALLAAKPYMRHHDSSSNESSNRFSNRSSNGSSNESLNMNSSQPNQGYYEEQVTYQQNPYQIGNRQPCYQPIETRNCMGKQGNCPQYKPFVN